MRKATQNNNVQAHPRRHGTLTPTTDERGKHPISQPTTSTTHIKLQNKKETSNENSNEAKNL
jgi:hypothetical protein